MGEAGSEGGSRQRMGHEYTNEGLGSICVVGVGSAVSVGVNVSIGSAACV